MYSLASGVYSYYFSPKSISVLFVGCDGAGKTSLLERCKISNFTKRRFAPAAGAVSCHGGAKGKRNRLTNYNKGAGSRIIYSCGNASTSESCSLHFKNAPQQHLNIEKIRPTAGQNIAKNIDLFGLATLIWDLSGRQEMRGIWQSYYAVCDALVFVLDATIFSPTKGDPNPQFEATKKELTNILLEKSLCNVPLLVWVNKFDSVRDQHVAKCGKSSSDIEVMELDDLDKYLQDELYECVMQLLGLASASKASPLTSVSLGPELIDVPPCHSFGKAGQPGRIEVFIGSAKSGQGVRPAMEWLAQTALLSKK